MERPIAAVYLTGFVFALLLLTVFIFLRVSPARAFVVNRYEDITFRFDPSAERALAYGERHFNAQDPAEYDISRAHHFLKLAAIKDPTLPYIFHELARVDFLKGDFKSALEKINYQISQYGNEIPSSYYIRGLIEGYAGDYDAAVADYKHFLEIVPPNWAAINDYAWVLLKAGNPLQAASVTGEALNIFPRNAWLLNTNATALYEIGEMQQALIKARAAVKESEKLGPNDWLLAYPGNDPRIAASGIAAFKEAARANMHTIELAVSTSTVL